MSTSFIDELMTLLTVKHILEHMGLQQGFIIEKIEKLLATIPTTIHPCDIPGRLSCGNPESDY